MDTMNAAPIDHSAASAFASTFGGGASGALKGGVKGLVTGFAAPGVLGAVVLGGIGLFGGLGLAIAGVLVGGLAGSIFLGAPLASLGALLGSIFGGAKGISRASDQVSQERGAAAVLNAQVEIGKAQMQTVVNDNRYNFPAQGSAMNMAGTSISGMQADGRINGMQLQRA